MCSAIPDTAATRCVITINWSAASTATMAAEFVRTGDTAEDGVTPAATHVDIVTVRLRPVQQRVTQDQVTQDRVKSQVATPRRVPCTRREE